MSAKAKRHPSDAGYIAFHKKQSMPCWLHRR
eukprot:CAMPEP_0119334560 /NCGR_PEP_ID=MMETSP1333-20130426/87586_1 /TAXON_ID=418940 /ORGANISM="Scyphosphaera apsteinii, Strain RCC1455" /LENGTH=30 /DNA_ID= /DNA_START= /DNA_END= /DNA_ORIENTATION=